MTHIAVVMTTYAPMASDRSAYAYETLVGLLDKLKGAEFHLHVADDGSYDTGYIRNMCRLADGTWPIPSTTTDAERNGIGKSLNLALEYISSHVWMYMTDDWLLTHTLHVGLALDLIEKGYDYVRLGPIHPHLMCSTEFNAYTGWWLRIHQGHGGFAFATRPFIATKDFWKRVGPFKEQVDSYECEKDYNERVCKVEELKLACYPSLAAGWEHIGVENVGYLDAWR